MRYLGSKTLLVHQILNLIGEHDPGAVFCDPFGGIGTVGKFMKQNGFSVVSGDVLNFAHFFQKSLIEMDTTPSFSFLKNKSDQALVEYLNSAIAEDGWFISEYSEKRCFFTEQNAKHIQGCIDEIWEWNARGYLSKEEYALLIASLVQSMDKVANTAGTYYAYLKNTYRKAVQPFRFALLPTTEGRYPCHARLEDANELVKNQKCSILYLDPPYNEREYSQYYHLPETVALGCIPEPTGKSGIPKRAINRSAYTKRTEAKKQFSDLICNANAEMIIFHYADNGLIDEESTREILNTRGRVQEYYFDCKGYRTVKDNNKQSRHHIYKVIT